jgi:importin subunit alpha-6/7
MESKSQSHRLGQFKNKSTFKTDEVRRRREAQSVEIRKQKREDNLAKRRNLNAIGKEDMSESEDEMEQAVDLQVRIIAISNWLPTKRAWPCHG